MNLDGLNNERIRLLERIQFLDAMIASVKPKPEPSPPYGCQRYAVSRLCRYDHRAVDRKCDGCPRVTDRQYLESMGLWIQGVSHRVDFQ